MILYIEPAILLHMCSLQTSAR